MQWLGESEMARPREEESCIRQRAPTEGNTRKAHAFPRGEPRLRDESAWGHFKSCDGALELSMKEGGGEMLTPTKGQSNCQNQVHKFPGETYRNRNSGGIQDNQLDKESSLNIWRAENPLVGWQQHLPWCSGLPTPSPPRPDPGEGRNASGS